MENLIEKLHEDGMPVEERSHVEAIILSGDKLALVGFLTYGNDVAPRDILVNETNNTSYVVEQIDTVLPEDLSKKEFNLKNVIEFFGVEDPFGVGELLCKCIEEKELNMSNYLDIVYTHKEENK